MNILFNTKLILVIGSLILFTLNGCGGSSDTTEGVVVNTAPQYKPAGWYMKTTASVTDANNVEYTHDTAGVFGELKQSSDGKDQHDIPVLSGGMITVVFPQTEWNENNGDYFTDYHAYSDNDEKKVWTFQVKSSLKNAPLKISLVGSYDVLYLEVDGRVSFKELLASDQSKKESIYLIDVDNQTRYTFAELQTLILNMDGLSTRTFRWVLGEPSDEDYEPLTMVSLKTVSLKKTNTEETQTLTDPSDKFGLPPQ